MIKVSFKSFHRIDLSSTMTTFDTTNSAISHMQEDLFIPGNIVYSEGKSLKTTNGRTKQLIAGDSGVYGYAEGIGVDAYFKYIASFLQLNSTTLLVVDSGNHCLRLVDRITTKTSRRLGRCTLGGSEILRFHYPTTLIFDKMNIEQLLLIDSANRALKAINKTNWTKKNLFVFNTSIQPKRIFQQENGNLFVAIGHCIMEYNYVTKSASLITGSIDQNGFHDGSLPEARFDTPREMLVLPSDKLLVADRSNNRIRLIDLGWNMTFSICSGVSSTRDGNISYCGVVRPLALLAVNDTVYVGQNGAIRAVQGEIIIIINN